VELFLPGLALLEKIDEADPAGDDMTHSLWLSGSRVTKSGGPSTADRRRETRRCLQLRGFLVTSNFMRPRNFVACAVVCALLTPIACNLPSAQVSGAPMPGRGPTTERAPDASVPSDVTTSDPNSAGPPITLPDASTGLGDGAIPPESTCPTASDGDDKDHDGYTVGQGDCNDCDKAVNPGALDVAGNKVDEDCNATVDDEPGDCEVGLPLDGDAVAAAKALGICRMARVDAQGRDRTWGLIQAAYVFPDGTTASLKGGVGECGKAGGPPNPLSHGILPVFGKVLKARRGPVMVALSSGIARSGVNEKDPFGSSPDGAEMCTRSHAPMGFPVSSQATCGDPRRVPGMPPEIVVPGDDPTMANDAIALELVVRAPTNASALSFDFNFHTYEYSDYVCSEYNDHFVALMNSKAADLPANHNIAFDSQGNPVSVNNGFVEVCDPFTYEGKRNGMPFKREFPCKLGHTELAGTGFEEHAATGWLQTHANVMPGEDITLRFAVWDAGDSILDSTVLLDNFTWDAKPGTTVTTRAPPVVE
jgi:hypothetical protein